jgi:DNA-binding LacI/PurR family transcriptional regulator
MPLAELGSRSIDMLLGMIEGAPGADVLVTSPPELIVRGSCVPLVR